MKKHPPSKSGAALLIALGFLAILTLIIISFSIQTQTDRVASRTYLESAQSRQLLNTALSRAMADLETEIGGADYPGFFAFGSSGSGDPITNIAFETEKEFLPLSNPLIGPAYDQAVLSAEWEPVEANGTPIGRVAFIVVNTSGLLDANSVGGVSNNTASYFERRAGLSPKEIQLTRDDEIIPEFNGDSRRQEQMSFLLYDESNLKGFDPADTAPDLSPGLAFVYNRENAWRRFETLRDMYQLNRVDSRKIITTDISSFNTCSYAPTGMPVRTFMGNDYASVMANLDFIEAQLSEIPAIDTQYVINQLKDYLDTDCIPEDIDRSVEPVPLINEVILSCTIHFEPVIQGDGQDAYLSHVEITNECTASVEVWYPFPGYANDTTFFINNPDMSGSDLNAELFGDLDDWTGQDEIPSKVTAQWNKPVDLEIFTSNYVVRVSTTNELIRLFEELKEGDIEITRLECIDSDEKVYDQTKDIEIGISNLVENVLIGDVNDLAELIFSGINTNISFTLGYAAIDPRLNWDCTDTAQWIEVGDNETYPDTLGEINREVIQAIALTDDDKDRIYVRNADRIDTPYEFTYFLYDTQKPWQTIQMIEANDPDQTHLLLANLSPFENGPPTQGRINPYSPHKNAIAAAFMGMPVDEFNGSGTRYLSAKQAEDAAELFMGHIARNSWTNDAEHYSANIDMNELKKVFADFEDKGSKTVSPWILESFFRNTRELFNPRDTSFAILLAAQSVRQTPSGELIYSGTQKAVAYVWRDPQTGKAAITFWGLSDTLQKDIDWGNLLRDFQPKN